MTSVWQLLTIMMSQEIELFLCTILNLLPLNKNVFPSLSDPNGVIRRVFATQSFSIGIDCPNGREVIYYGPPKSLECYLQEIGRAGKTN